MYPIHEKLTEIVYPRNGVMPSMTSRMSVFDKVLTESVSPLTDIDPIIDPYNIIQLGVYCTRDMYPCVIQDKINPKAIKNSYDELRDFIWVINRDSNISKVQSNPSMHRVLGALSEIAVLTTIIGGMEEGHIPMGYALLSRNKGYKNGLRDDIDIKAKFNEKKYDIQVKTSQKNENWIYKKNIKVLSSMRLSRSVDSRAKSIAPLLNSHLSNSPESRLRAYKVLTEQLQF